jgi:hypothetical protein
VAQGVRVGRLPDDQTSLELDIGQCRNKPYDENQMIKKRTVLESSPVHYEEVQTTKKPQ